MAETPTYYQLRLNILEHYSNKWKLNRTWTKPEFWYSEIVDRYLVILNVLCKY